MESGRRFLTKLLVRLRISATPNGNLRRRPDKGTRWVRPCGTLRVHHTVQSTLTERDNKEKIFYFDVYELSNYLPSFLEVLVLFLENIPLEVSIQTLAKRNSSRD